MIKKVRDYVYEHANLLYKLVKTEGETKLTWNALWSAVMVQQSSPAISCVWG